MTKRFLRDAAERASKTFCQAYAACWLAIEPTYERLFTTDNLKAGVVGVALSVATSVGSKAVNDRQSASLVQ